jgi:methyl-accepting chemotaxis protein
MLHPLTSLLSELVGAQSAAVRGEPVNVESVRNALGKVNDHDGEYGDALWTGQRLADLTSQIESAFARADTGRAAYETYSTLVNLTLQLLRRTGDSSHLIHDPDLDSFYLMDAATTRLPDAVVYAGRAADLVALAGGRPLTGEDQVRAAVARFGVSYDAERVADGLTTSVDFTSRAELGTNIAQRFDAFRAAADAFAPPTMLQDLATTVDAGTMAANARRVSAAATALAHLLLSESSALLDNRAASLSERRQ